MGETNRILFDYREIVTALLKKEHIHDGNWMIYVEFGLAAVNAPVNDPAQEPAKDPLENLMPTAIIPIKKIGIQRTEQASNLSVDAAIVNPKPKQTRARSKKKV